MAEHAYHPPVSHLLRHDSYPTDLEDLPNYVSELGLTVNDIPELVRLAKDSQFYENRQYANQAESEAPLRAGHALAQLAVESPEAAVAGLMQLVGDEESDAFYWYGDEIEDFIVPVGPPAIAGLVPYFRDASQPELARMVAQECLSSIAQNYPETQDRYLQELVACLERYEENLPVTNAAVIAGLIDLKAVETAPLIEAAYRAERVDLSFVGTWASVQVELGLKDASEFDPEDFDVPLHLHPWLATRREPSELFASAARSQRRKRGPTKGFGDSTPPKKKSKKKSKSKK